ncbi:MAG: type 4a pilus biogenesis protein PilO [Candidatus Schekmanbacteria bacterium]|nr:type 4a pilus biogenesis protein PilO [Candidatus Schekmanbacteria bacterium]
MIEFLEKFSDTQKYAATAVLIVALLTAFYFVSYKGNEEEIARLDEQTAWLKAKIQEAQATTAQYDDFRNKVALVRAQLNRTLDVLPHEDEMETLITAIHGLAAQSGLHLGKFVPGATITHEFFGEIPVQINAQGGYHQVGKFFERIANESRIVNIGNLSMKSTRRLDPSVECEFVARAFFFQGANK